MELRFNRIAIKVGSNVLTNKDGSVDDRRIAHIVDQIAALRSNGVEVVLISSGAVAYGRSEITLPPHLDSVSSRQILSAVGQAKLINRYYELFKQHGIFCGQVLTMKENFRNRQQYLNQKNCMSAMLQQGVIPIVNENDTTSLTELMFTDNDELSGLIATMMDMDALIILSNIDGIYNGDPSDPESSVIREVLPEKSLSQYIQASKSSFGRGGMRTKCNIARKVAAEGIAVIIANGKKDGIISSLMQKGNDVMSTVFKPSERVSSVKKWIAHSEGFSKGEVHVNAGAEEALAGGKASSLLFVGIDSIKGEFKKGDIVKIFGPEGNELGVGRVQYGSDKAKTLVGKKGVKPFIHCDYLLPVTNKD